MQKSPKGWTGALRSFQPLALSWPFVVLAALVVSASATGALLPIKAAVYELRFDLARRPPSGDIVLVEIDSKSIAALGTWPWPRRVHGALVDELTEAGAAQIGFDVDFSARSDDAEDAMFEDALRRAGGSTILATFAQKLSNARGDNQIAFNRPLKRFADNAWAATVNVFPDRDGLVRRFPFGAMVAGEPTPSMPAMLANTPGQIGGDFLIDFGIQALDIDRISAIDVLGGRVETSRLAGRKVIIGASAVELRDFFQVPALGHIPGPLVQALAAETLAQGRSLRETGMPLAAGGAILICLGGVALRRMRWSVGLVTLAGCAVSFELAGVVLQRLHPILLDSSAWQASLAGVALIATAREIDFRRILLAISRQETQDTRTVLDQIVADNFAGVIVATDDGVITAASRMAADILHPGAGAPLIGRTIEETLPADLVEIMRHAMQQYREGSWRPRQPGDFAYARGGRSTSILEYVVTPSRLGGRVDENGAAAPDRVAACLTFVDITERRNAEARIAYMAQFDTLTGEPNRNQFAEKLAQAMQAEGAAGAGCTLFHFDIDRFKTVNDTLGRRYGDLLLREVAKRARLLIAQNDFIARLDSDQFVVIRTGPVTRDEAEALAERLVEKLGRPYLLDGHRAIVSVSMGIAQSDDADDPVSLTKNAETAHRRSKDAGGNRWSFFDAALDLGFRDRQRLELELREALERDEFAVAYQPQIELQTNEIIGVEALVRWRHPTRGFVSPAEFIPVAEDTGLIEPLGAWVLRRACEDAASWPRAIKVAVNVSPVQFTRGDLVKTVADALEATGLPASRLELEITESLFVRESAETIATADAVRRMGIGFALDDFGTGYSSLNYLRKFEVQKIKLDRSFVAGLPAEQESIAIVQAVINMARDLGIRTNAEGIETAEQRDCLKGLGCKEGQGYLFGKPQPAADIARALGAPAAQAA
ncbi:MAG TPA: EAL domain-containing protein [Beijerinckiaceae bacterium]|nr:EAL domain-containing protein [Beijerinckiaceae bacterium]